MSNPDNELENRVIDLVKQHSESPIRATGRMVTVTRSIEVYGKGGYYAGSNTEYYEEEEPETVYDTSRREAAISELVQIGQPAVPILTAILASETGEYPNNFSNINDGVLDALLKVGSKSVSRELVEPFQRKVTKIVELKSAEGYHPVEPYNDQVWSIARLWEEYPIREAIPTLENALRVRYKDVRNVEVSPFSEYIRQSFFGALSRIGTKEAIVVALNIGQGDAQHKQYHWSDFELARISLQRDKKQIGTILYDIYRSTQEPTIRELTSSALGSSRIKYWMKRLVGPNK